jgi:hypothetical protein
MSFCVYWATWISSRYSLRHSWYHDAIVIIKAFSLCTFSLWLFSSSFFGALTLFIEVGGTSLSYLYSPMFNYRAVNRCRGPPHFRLPLPLTFPFPPRLLCALLLLRLPQLDTS